MEVKINVNDPAIRSKRPEISHIGALLSGKLFSVAATGMYPDFMNEKTRIEEAGNKELILNRDPYAISLSEIGVTSVKLDRLPLTDDLVIRINEGDSKNEFTQPITGDLDQIGVVTDDAFAEAVNGEKGIIFKQGMEVYKRAHIVNDIEVKRLIDFRNRCTKMIDAIKKIDQDNYAMVKSSVDAQKENYLSGTVLIQKTTDKED